MDFSKFAFSVIGIFLVFIIGYLVGCDIETTSIISMIVGATILIRCDIIVLEEKINKLIGEK